MLWANLVGENDNEEVKIGQAQKITLRGKGLLSDNYKFAQGFNGVVRLNVWIDEANVLYKNANFGYAVEVTADDANWTISDTSMSAKTVDDCTANSGVAYVDVNFTSPSGSAGTVSLVNVLVGNEF